MRAERKRRVKKAMKKVERITMRGVRIAASCASSLCFVYGVKVD